VPDPVVDVPRQQALFQRNALEFLDVLDIPQRQELAGSAYLVPSGFGFGFPIFRSL
jgi:hypothetical protein